MFCCLSSSVRLLLCIQICFAITLEKRFPLNRNGLQFTNMVFNGSLIYAAEDRRIHVLDPNLSLQQSYPTCAPDDCENINKILTFYNSMIVACGTGNNGICQVWKDGALVNTTSSQSSNQNYPSVSTNIHRPAVGLVNNGDLYMGVTGGDGLGTSDVQGETKKYLLTKTDMTKSFSLESYVSLQNNGHENYLVYFRKVFMKDKFVYFLTSQKLNLNANGYKTKLVRICTNKTNGDGWTRSYTDIVLSCEVEGVDYNLLQDAEFLPSTGNLVAFFSKGDDPEGPTADSAICVYTIDAVDDAILRAKEDFVTCSTTDSTNKASAYVDIELSSCVSNMSYRISEYVCPSTGGTKVIGSVTLKSNSSHKLADSSSRITKVRGIDRYGRYSDVYLGTDKGSISKVSIDDGLNIVVYESNVTVDKGHTVRDIHISDNLIYVLSNRKVFRFKDKECSEFMTCEDTMNSKNPCCGWCVIEGRSLKRSNCTDSTTWLSSLSACVSADVTPKYMPVRPSTTVRDSCPSLLNTTGIYIPNGIRKTILLHAAHLTHFHGHSYNCILKNTTVEGNEDFDNHTISCSIEVSYEENIATSEMPISVVEAAGGTEAQLKDDFNNSVIVYKCEQLATDCTMCGALKKDRHDCHWCVEGHCGHKSTCEVNNTCPLPTVTKAEPPAGGYKGRTRIRMEGKNFGTNINDISDVKVGDITCDWLTIAEINNPDFERFNRHFQCTIAATNFDTSLIGREEEISFKFKGAVVKTGGYRFTNPTITSVTPNFAPLFGGAAITMSGTDLDVGNGIDFVKFGDQPSILCLKPVHKSSSIVCTTPRYGIVLNTTTIRLRIDGEPYDSELMFKFLPSPDIEELVSAKSAVSGGSNFTVRGKNFLNAAEVKLWSSYAGERLEGTFMSATPHNLTFRSPPAPQAVLKELRENESGQGRRRRKRSTFDPSITVEATIKMDGYEKTYPYTYFKDPVFEEFPDFEATKIIRSRNKKITMKGSYLNLAAGEADYHVSIGKTGSCIVTLLTETNLTCALPEQNPDGVDRLEVHVQLGFFVQKVGYVKYKLMSEEEKTTTNILAIMLAILGCLVLIGTVGIIVFCIMYRRAKQRVPNIKISKKKEKKLNRITVIKIEPKTKHTCSKSKHSEDCINMRLQ